MRLLGQEVLTRKESANNGLQADTQPRGAYLLPLPVAH
jgi:hypothetical protein